MTSRLFDRIKEIIGRDIFISLTEAMNGDVYAITDDGGYFTFYPSQYDDSRCILHEDDADDDDVLDFSLEAKTYAYSAIQEYVLEHTF